MKLRLWLSGALICGMVSQGTNAEHIISLFFRPYPSTMSKKDGTRMVHKLSRAEKAAKYSIGNTINYTKTSGVVCSYAGYLTVSNLDGQVVFPRRHEEPAVHILVTEHIAPVIMTQNTIHHWEIEKTAPAALYKVERQEDENIQTHFWNVTKAELPEEHRIPLNTIVIIAKPRDIYVPEGITITQKNEQLILPDLYVRKTLNPVTSALYALNLQNFFSPSNIIHEKRSSDYANIVTD